ncbi:hypothetical protein BU14_0153s0040 [Porphyra umbilicalis]|uniref:Uncharacterized protein n=1 Tax=Porphyra umbilicalis TaxID=2786 RepID=A0A1X6P8W8_PORUM|nr:hypothetical protein BU14_0153s0040 [Porphyra umbilicalis]|eukprot:OSX77298.1 hypothetical protein BU14_0153s0040 [Porphyra umbilicalis]
MPGSSSMNTHLRRVSSLAGQLRNLASIARSVLRGIVIVLLIFLVLLGGGVATLLAALHSPTFVPLLAGAATALLGGIVYLKWVEADELVGTLQLWSGGDLEQPPPGLAGSPEVEARESRARRSVRSSASELARVRSEGTLVPLIKEKEAALAAAEAAWRSARAERTRSIKTALMLAPDNMLLSVATTLMGVPAAVAGVGALLVWGVNAGWAHILGLLILAGGGWRCSAGRSRGFASANCFTSALRPSLAASWTDCWRPGSRASRPWGWGWTGRREGEYVRARASRCCQRRSCELLQS